MSIEEFRDWGKEHIEDFKKISSILNQFNDIYNEVNQVYQDNH